MSRRSTLLIAVVCLVAVSCGSSVDDSPADGDTITDTTGSSGDTDPADGTAASCGAGLGKGEAIEQARSIAEADSGGDIADDFLSSPGVVAAANVREDFWEVTFSTESGAIEIYLTCTGDLASVGTNGNAQP